MPQYFTARVLWIWAAAALPMGALAWIVAPAIAGEDGNLIPVLMVCLTAGLIWQFVLVLLLNGFSLRKLWLQRPSTSDGRRGGRLWLWVLPFVLGFGALQFRTVRPANRRQPRLRRLPRRRRPARPPARQLGTVRSCPGDDDLQHGARGGVALPRAAACPGCGPTSAGSTGWPTVPDGRVPPAPAVVDPDQHRRRAADGVPTKRWRSAWMGIIVHSTPRASSWPWSPWPWCSRSRVYGPGVRCALNLPMTAHFAA